MEKPKPLEQKEESIDVTEEFLSMSVMNFLGFLREHRNDPSLAIVITWDDSNKKLDESTLIRLKAFLEDGDSLRKGQKRSATVRATAEQKDGPVLSKSNCRNAFSSRVKWEKI